MKLLREILRLPAALRRAPRRRRAVRRDYRITVPAPRKADARVSLETFA